MTPGGGPGTRVPARGTTEAPVPGRRPAAVALAGAAAALVVCALYAPAIGRGFTSEDFLLIRFLGERPPWEDLRALFGEPWLGVEVVRFLRPVATLLLGLEVAAFGAWSPGYEVTHLLAHLATALMLAAAARRLLAGVGPGRGGRPADGGPQAVGDGSRAAAWPALAVGLLFALYPLHPNAVVFAASFATLFAGALMVAALLAYVRWRQQGGAGHAVALGCFALALGCYEAAVVLPAWLAAADHLVLQRPSRRSHLRVAAGWLPFAALAALYLLWRQAVLGEVLGGYAGTGERLLAPRLAGLAGDLALSLQRLHLPLVADGAERAVAAVVAALLVAVPPALALWWRRGGWLRPWALGWVLVVTGLAPFAFEPAVPASGRYVYLAAMGTALWLGALAAGAAAGGRIARRVAAAALAGVAVAWAVLLARDVGYYRDAGVTAAAVQTELRRLAATAPGAPVFLTGYPYFLTDRLGTPLAQVYHYGLHDAARPPFREPPLAVYPLPPLSGAELQPVVAGAAGALVARWDGARAAVVAPPGDGALALFEPRDLPPAARAGRVTHPEELRVAVRVPAGPHATFRLLLAAPLNGFSLPVDARPGPGGVLRPRIPGELVAAVRTLYGGGTIHWWVEGRDGNGRLTGYSPMRPLAIAPR